METISLLTLSNYLLTIIIFIIALYGEFIYLVCVRKSGIGPVLVAPFAILGYYIVESHLILLAWLLGIIIVQILIFWILEYAEETSNKFKL